MFLMIKIFHRRFSCCGRGESHSPPYARTNNTHGRMRFAPPIRQMILIRAIHNKSEIENPNSSDLDNFILFRCSRFMVPRLRDTFYNKNEGIANNPQCFYRKVYKWLHYCPGIVQGIQFANRFLSRALPDFLSVLSCHGKMC